MPQDEDEQPEVEEESSEVAVRRPWRRIFQVFFVMLGLVVIAAWLGREQIAQDVISGQLEELGLPATYEVTEIGTGTQTIRNVVIGDPDAPDLTIEQVDVEITTSSGLPAIARIRLIKPRAYGVWRDGQMSFGSLDPLIYTDSEEPFQLPDLNIEIVDGRALLEGPFGAIGAKADGKGNLRSGFAGELAAVAPDLAIAGCQAGRTSLYGKVSISDEEPRFSGPLRTSKVKCPALGLAIGDLAARIDTRLNKQLDAASGEVSFRSGSLAYGANTVRTGEGTGRFTYGRNALTARYDVAAKGISSPQAVARELGLEGQVRGRDGFARLEVEGNVTGAGLGLGEDLGTALAGLEQSGASTPVGDIAAQIGNALRREQRGSSLSGRYIVRKTGDVVNVVLPRAVLRGGSGQSLLAVSRFNMRAGGEAAPRITGNFVTGGAGLPQISGRMEQSTSGAMAMRIKMPEYRAGDTRIAMHRMQVAQSPRGAVGFAGELRLSGMLPGGVAEGLVVPLDGNWSPAGGLSVWRRCTTLGFDRLAIANLKLHKRALTICPSGSGAIVRSDARGLRVAGGIARLDLAGKLGTTPIRMQSGAVGVAWPGFLNARAVDIALGPRDTASRFTISSVEATLGSNISGRFDGADIRLDAVPLDMLDTSGKWTFADGVVAVTDGALRVEDREQVDRFQPLIARNGTLRLANNVITAQALLREPVSDREIVRTDIRHDLSTGRGGADLMVDGIVFDGELQPDTVTRLALGVVANAEGVVTGHGNIGWTETDVTSSGAFDTRSFDFAAAFGPVKGVSGTVVFTDLLGVVTAPDQQLKIAAINPGIEVFDGELTFEIKPDYVLEVDRGHWPFLGGTLKLDPVRMVIGSDEPSRYTLHIEGLDAARFVEQIELGNLSATGSFDGAIPLVFDKDGGRIEGGLLTSQQPGGNISYVGELTYEDLSTMANFAFDALRSLNYRTMEIGMDGSLEGEIIAKVKFDGVTQGEGASSNFLTRRIASLPIRFNVNVRAPFLQLMTSFKSMYDPQYVRDPRTLGLIDPQNIPEPGVPPGNGPQQPIQPSDSRNMP